MLASSFASAEMDKENRALAEIKVEGKQIIAMIQEALNADKGLIKNYLKNHSQAYLPTSLKKRFHA